MKWLALVVTLTTSLGAVRVGTWRALKASGRGALRDGVYLLPDRADCSLVFSELSADGEAIVLELAARDAAQQRQFVALFDRSAEFKAFEVELAQRRQLLRSASEVPGRRILRALAQRLETLRGIDFFDSERGAKAATALEDLRVECEARWSPGEPTGSSQGVIARLDAIHFRARVWATRRRPWVDRFARAWLFLRFVDPAARI